MARDELNKKDRERELFRERATRRLVREAIQNSLDASSSSEVPVHMRFSLHSNAISPSEMRPWLQTLVPHLEKSREALHNLRNSEHPKSLEQLLADNCSYLVVEDFGTTGLTGDTSVATDAELKDGEKNNFYYFYKNIDRTEKDPSKAGSWGLGKLVYASLSSVNAILALTKREDDGRILLMGQAGLQIHTIDGAQFSEHGHFGIPQMNDFPAPVDASNSSGHKSISAFCELFKVSAERSSENGLSIVIPFVDEEQISANDIVCEVLEQYLWPILNGRLSVEVCRDDKFWCVDTATNLAELTNHLDWTQSDMSAEQILAVAGLIKVALDRQDPIQLPESGKHKAPSWDELIPACAEQIEVLRTRLTNNKAAVVEIPMWTSRKPLDGEQAEEVARSKFQLVLRRPDALEPAVEYSVRGQLAIPNKRRGSARQLQALMFVEAQETLAMLLRDSENPSHTKWNPHTEHAVSKWRRLQGVISFVRKASGALFDEVEETTKQRDDELLLKIFSVVVPDDNRSTSHIGVYQRETKRPRVPRLPRVEPFRIEKLDAGFVVTRGRTGAKKNFKVQVAYATNRGDAYSAYDENDFQLDSSQFRTRFASCSGSAKKNELHVVASSKDFRVEVQGFDTNRDIEVRALEEPDGEVVQ